MSEWKEYKLGEFGFFNNGVNKDKFSFGHGFPFVNLLDIFDKDTINYIPKGLVKVNQDELSRYNLKEGDILFVRSSVKLDGVGKVCVVTKDLENTIYSGFIIRYRQTDLILDKLFASYYLNSAPIRTKIIAKATLSANSNINQESLKTIPIRIPSLQTQRKISHILSTADAVIEKTQAAIAKYKAIKQGMLHDLFTRGIDITTGKLRPRYEDTPELYKESSLGFIPREWEVDELGNRIISHSGGTPSRSIEDYFKGDIPWISSSEVNQDKITFTEEHINQEALENSSAKWVKKDSVLVAMYGATAGQVAMLKIDATTNQAVLACLESETIKSDFLYYLLIFLKERILYKAQGSGQPNLSKQIIDSLEIPIVSLGEQKRIAKCLNTIDNKLITEQIYLQKIQSIKQGLMSELLSGRKKVNVEKEAKKEMATE